MAQGRVGSNGGYFLASYAECTEFYKGPLEGLNIYVVGRGTDQEKVFLRSDLAGASDYSKQVRLLIENLPSAGVCHQAVTDLYAAASA